MFSSVVERTSIGAEGLGLDSGSVKSDTVSQTTRPPAIYFRSCVGQALSRGDGPRHSLYASALCREYKENLILIFDTEFIMCSLFFKELLFLIICFIQRKTSRTLFS